MFFSKIERFGTKSADKTGTVTGPKDHNILTNVKVMI